VPLQGTSGQALRCRAWRRRLAGRYLERERHIMRLVVRFVFFLAENFLKCQESLYQSSFATMLQYVQLCETHPFSCFRHFACPACPVGKNDRIRVGGNHKTFLYIVPNPFVNSHFALHGQCHIKTRPALARQKLDNATERKTRSGPGVYPTRIDLAGGVKPPLRHLLHK